MYQNSYDASELSEIDAKEFPHKQGELVESLQALLHPETVPENNDNNSEVALNGQNIENNSGNIILMPIRKVM